MSDKPTVQQALAAVMAELPAIGKADKSPEGYAYRGIEAITKHLQPLLAKHGVLIVPSGTIVEQRPSPAMKEGWTDTILACDWTIVGPDGSSITARTNGIGRDRADKGGNKAATQAFKVLLLQLFCVADKADDADGLTYEQDRVERPAVWGKAQAKQHVTATLKTKYGLADKEVARQCWTEQGMDRMTGYTAESIEAQVDAWMAQEEPFDTPTVDPETGEVTAA